MESENPPPHDAALMAFEIVVCSLGVIGNGLVIFVVLILREYKKSVTNWYVLQLAIADALFLLTIPFKVVEDWNNEWIFPGGVCKGKEAVLYINYYSSIFFLMVMSFDRYIAVCHPFSSMQKLRSYQACYIATVGVWVLSILLSIPIWLFSDKRGVEPYCTCSYNFPPDVTIEEECASQPWLDLNKCINLIKNAHSCGNSSIKNANYTSDYSYTDETYDFHNNSYHSSEESVTESYAYDSDIYGNYEYDNNSYSSGAGSNFEPSDYNQSCTYENQPKGFKVFIIFNFVALFLIPLLVMCICYTLIGISMQKFRARSETLKSSSSQSSGKKNISNSEKDKTRVTVICAILVILFVICWLPFHLTSTLKIKGISGTENFCNKLTSIVSLLSYVNSALNPYVYNFIGTKFMQKFRRAARSVGVSFGGRSQNESMSSGTGRQYKRSETKLTAYSSGQDDGQKGEKSEDGKTMLLVSCRSSEEIVDETRV